MQDRIPSPYVVYLYGHIFVPESKFGHKHLVSGKRLNPAELRKTIKLAMLVELYSFGIIDFEIAEVGKLIKRREVFVKMVKNVDDSKAVFFIEKELLSLLKNFGKVPLRFSINRSTGLEEKFWMDTFAERINLELAARGYLTKINNQFRPVEERIMLLREEAERIKQKLEEFRAKNPELAELVYGAL
ncbi:MAG: hypothetical protein QXL77_00950 [Candidatus Bathyarchaeia archaeon]